MQIPSDQAGITVLGGQEAVDEAMILKQEPYLCITAVEPRTTGAELMCLVQKQLDQAGITVLGGEEAVKEIGNLKKAPSPKHEYGNCTLTLEIVRSMAEAVDHIHSFGSGHTEAIITGVHVI